MKRVPNALADAGELAATLIAMAAAAVGGSVLLAVAEDGYYTFPGLVQHVALPAAAVIAALAAAAALARRLRLWAGILLGFWTGLAGTVVLEAVRETGVRVFHSMPGDLPQLMGVLLTNRIMSGPDVWSNLARWGDHFWNGAAFAIPYMLIVGGFPRRGKHWHAAMLGAAYGALLGTGFLLSPVPRATGAGIFGSIIGPKYVITVYLAHLGFGALVGWLAHRVGTRLEPLWTQALGLARLIRPHAPARLESAADAGQRVSRE